MKWQKIFYPVMAFLLTLLVLQIAFTMGEISAGLECIKVQLEGLPL